MRAILAGMIFIVVTSLGTDAILYATDAFASHDESPPDLQFIWASAYRFIYGVIGAYLTARLALRDPMRHCLILGAIGLSISIFGAVATWNAGPEFGPHWYPLFLVVTALPGSWLGAKIFLYFQPSKG
jgi:surface polysaccharide O-acyltransferase-like enzyme